MKCTYYSHKKRQYIRGTILGCRVRKGTNLKYSPTLPLTFPTHIILTFSQHSIFSHKIFSQLNQYSVSRAGRTPSVNKGNNGLSLSSPPTTPLQKATAVSFPLFLIFPQHSTFFSQHLFNSISIQSVALGTLPQSMKGPRAHCHHPCLLLHYIRQRR